MFETSVLSENFSIYVKETWGEISIVWMKIIEEHDAVHAWFHIWSVECSHVWDHQLELFILKWLIGKTLSVADDYLSVF